MDERKSAIEAALKPFSRQEMLPAELPPAGERGMVKWLRQNLFSGPLNTILTLVALLVVGKVVWGAFPWWWNSVWNANSLAECREIIAQNGGTDGACWGVIKARWHQYLFGFYPPAEHWRPVLALGLLLAAIAPVLFWERDRKSAVMIAAAGVGTLLVLFLLSTPGTVLLAVLVLFAGLFALALGRQDRLLLVTALYPFFAVWLLWGGSFWSPVNQLIAVVVGVVLALLYWRNQQDWLNTVFAVIVALAAAYVASIIISYADAISGDFLRRLNAHEFWPGFMSESGILGRSLGALLSSLLWLATVAIWLLLAVMRVVSFVLNLGFGTVADFPYAGNLTIGAALSFAAVFAAARNRSPVIGILGGILGGALWYMLAGPAILAGLAAVLPLAILPIASDQMGGFLLAFVIGVSAIVASLPLGILLALGRRSDMWLMKVLSVGFIEFIRGVPLITLLFTASLLLQYFLPPRTNFDLILRVIILASLFSAAYLAEVIRGGLAALPRGQYEAADSLGLDYWQAQRLIIMPQALKISIPGIVSTFIGLFMDTTLVSFVGLLDPLRGVTMAVRADINWKGIYWEPYIFVSAIFFIICFSMARYAMYLERKLKTDHR